MDLAMEFERLLARHGTAKIGLNTAAGESRHAGGRVSQDRGFRPLPSGEDRDIVAVVVGAGFEPSRLRRPCGLSAAVGARRKAWRSKSPRG